MKLLELITVLQGSLCVIVKYNEKVVFRGYVVTVEDDLIDRYGMYTVTNINMVKDDIEITIE